MSEENKTMDYSSTKLALEDVIPHAAVVKKLKKYSGQNYSKATGGKIFRTNPLKVLQYARAEVEGSNQNERPIKHNQAQTPARTNLSPGENTE